MVTPDTVIDELGGNSVLAEALEVDDSTVSTWRRRGIPPGRWPALVRLARRKRLSAITWEVLASVGPAEVQA